MTLSQKVERLVDQAAKDDVYKDRALRDAEMLADRYKDVQPKTYSIPMEKFHGLPAYSK